MSLADRIAARGGAAIIGGAVAAAPQVKTAFWTLFNQATVSIGAFLVNVMLARHLPPGEYGAYALLLAAVLSLQMVLASLVFHPLSILRSVADPDESANITRSSIVLAGVVCAPLATALAVGLLFTGRADLLAPALAFFLAWQFQETTRRNLLSELRFRAAALGDTVSYPGQAVLAMCLAMTGELTLAHLLAGASMLFLTGAGLHLAQLGVPHRGPLHFRRIAKAFWATGRWSLLSNVVSSVRLLVSPWALAWLYGPAANALFQASMNIVAVANPIVTGLCNIIPQTAARESQHGVARAWRASRIYGFLGAPLIATVYGLAFALPQQTLRLIYGDGSPYVTLADAVRILVVGSALAYSTELICSFFHGVDRPRAAFLTNAAGATSSAILAFPLIWVGGVDGACAVVAISNAVRLGASCFLLSRMIARDVR
ncbi:lipopolysaccharide biosynthesis protein [Hansschlegelia zhihuaiae]|uniref:Lipopolysaccharide biosynthesis protein n=1 Tax=Hansschlegelia zhihuaiae TaxID=405005 RepID=A0A4Q0MCL5_9HYPH|nr:oligosaccharide flippase family protein [Hansschlegelia zhihuaiae]RXF70944.1 hypothetical protein EK403_16175 [Hansschlegelia zhihuaiae]